MSVNVLENGKIKNVESGGATLIKSINKTVKTNSNGSGSLELDSNKYVVLAVSTNAGCKPTIFNSDGVWAINCYDVSSGNFLAYANRTFNVTIYYFEI